MEIRNSTSRQLTIYICNVDAEEPETVKILLSGESFNLDKNMASIISIQEN